MKWLYKTGGSVGKECEADSNNAGDEEFARLEVDRLDDHSEIDIAVIGKPDGSLRILITSDTSEDGRIPLEILDERSGRAITLLDERRE